MEMTSDSRSFARRDGVADQLGSDLRASADAVRTALDDALQRLRKIEGESALTVLIGRIARRFRHVYPDIDDLASRLESRSAGEEEVLDQLSR